MLGLLSELWVACDLDTPLVGGDTTGGGLFLQDSGHKIIARF